MVSDERSRGGAWQLTRPLQQALFLWLVDGEEGHPTHTPPTPKLESSQTSHQTTSGTLRKTLTNWANRSILLITSNELQKKKQQQKRKEKKIDRLLDDHLYALFRLTM